MRLTRTAGLAGALILAALVGGTVIGSVLATDEPADSSSDPAAGAGLYCDTFLDALASELGISRDELTAAGKAAAAATIDSAVAAGDLTQARADELNARIDEADGDGCAILRHGGVFGHGFARGHSPGFENGFGHGFGRGLLGGDAGEAAADALGVESSSLLRELHEAGSLQAVAEDHGVSFDDVKSAITDAVQSDLDTAVADGDVSQERADAALERVGTWLDEGGPVPARHGG